MNDFREWLSDNLRYIMLGAGIILILILIFFGIRFVSSAIASHGTSVHTENVSTPTPDITETEAPTPTPEEEEPVVSASLEKNAVPEVFMLIGNYYNAISSKDITALRDLVDTLTTEDESMIQENTVEAYSNINVYTKTINNNSYVTFVSYKYKLSGITTLVPGLSQLYICTGEDGRLYISTAAPDAATQAYIDETVKSSEVQTLVTEIQSEYNTAVASDPALATYFGDSTDTDSQQPEQTTNVSTAEPTPEVTVPETTPESTPTTTSEPVTVVLKSSARFREAPSNDSTVYGTIPAGTQMLKLSEGDGWFYVQIDGQNGYIAARFF